MKSILVSLLLLLVAAARERESLTQKNFMWNWRDSQEASQVLATSTDFSLTEHNQLLRALTARLKDSPGAQQAAVKVRVLKVDLNGDGTPEVIAQAADDYNCSPTGNCTFWVFQKTRSDYTPILERPAIQRFTIQPHKTHGYSDLVVAQHGSAFEQGLWVYQFREGRYRRTGCYTARWQYQGEDGEYHDLREPQITHCTK